MCQLIGEGTAMSLDVEHYINLADEKLGAQVIYATDDFFADKSRLIQRADPKWREGVYDENGKWMDGWESRRKREEGHDFCIVRLGLIGNVAGVDIDTSFFTGNFPPAASIDACYWPDGDPCALTHWQEILPKMTLYGNSHHIEKIDSDEVYTHLRLNIYPDGGVARLRVYGRPSVDWQGLDHRQRVDLAAVENGGRALACSDQHYGNKSNILGVGRGENMGDGWETARRRTPGNDWVLVELGHAGNIECVVVDTGHFKGNFPDYCSIQAAYVEDETSEALISQSALWSELLPPQKLNADDIHEFTAEVVGLGPVTHVRLNIFPDGGISRLRLFGTKA